MTLNVLPRVAINLGLSTSPPRPRRDRSRGHRKARQILALALLAADAQFVTTKSTKDRHCAMPSVTLEVNDSLPRWSSRLRLIVRGPPPAGRSRCVPAVTFARRQGGHA